LPVTLKDVAEKVGRSITTVSRALHDYDDVSAETKTLVKQTAVEMGYTPSSLAQRLQKQQTDTIGLVLPTFGPRFSDPFFSELLAGIGNKAAEMGYDLLVSTQPPGEQELDAYKKLVDSRRVDGFIIVRTRRKDTRIDYLLDRGVPFTVFGRTDKPVNFPLVDEDGNYGMRLIAEHLVRQGHSRIACIAPDPELAFSTQRLNGLRTGLARYGVKLSDEYIRIGDLTHASGYEQGSILLDLPVPPTAIVACNDLMAFGAMSAVQERDLVVGSDIAITGFDDTPMAEHSHPPLTTVNQPVHIIGGMVCEMLIKLIKNEAIEDKQIILKPSLVIRQSCGCLPEKRQKVS